MTKPIIVLSPQSMPMEVPFRSEYHFTNAFNTQAIRGAGGIPVLPPYLDAEEAEALMRRSDALLLTGGEDISPALYGEDPLPACGNVCPRRDASDRALFLAARKLHKPILCICRGCQIANVFLGGTLWQDLPTQLPSAACHSDYPAYAEESAHRVRLLPDTPLHRLLGEESIPVNSLHHQAIHRLAPQLRPMALAPDGLIEAWYLPGQWLWGIQWHPEMLQDRVRGQAIFRAFLDACHS